MGSAEIIFSYFPDLTASQREKFSRLGEIYSDWNSKINLISRKDFDHFYERHVLHSLGIAKFISFVSGTRIMDVGTGGGFPGIPLAILFPEVQFLLVDSVGKKLKAPADAAEKLKLSNVDLFHGRAEKVEKNFDFIVGRALAALPEVVKLASGKFRSENRNKIRNGIIYLKGGDFAEELALLKSKPRIFDLSSEFKLSFFETKKVVYIGM